MIEKEIQKKPDPILKIVSDIYGISDDDVADFRSVRVLPGKVKAFDTLPKDDMKKMVAIDRVSPFELDMLYAIFRNRRQNHALGLHRIGDLIFGLYVATEDKKYKDLLGV